MQIWMEMMITMIKTIKTINMMIWMRRNNHVFFASPCSCADEKLKKKQKIYIVQ